MPYNPQTPCYTDPQYEAYKAAVYALMPINTNQKADDYRRVWEEFHGRRLPFGPKHGDT